MTSLRDQWVSIIKRKIDQELDLLRHTEEYKAKIKKSEAKVMEHLGCKNILDEIHKLQDLSQEYSQKSRELSQQASNLWGKLHKAIEAAGVPTSDPNYEWRDFGTEEVITREAEKLMIQNKDIVYYNRLKDLVEIRSNLKTQFLLATTPKQMRDLVDKIISKLSWNMNDLSK